MRASTRESRWADMNTTVTQEPATGEDSARAEISIEQRETEGLSQGQIVRRRFFRHRGAMISIIVLAIIVVLAFTSVGVNLWGLRIHGWWQYSWDEIPPKVNNGVPTLSIVPFQIGEHPFGQTRSAATSSRSSCAGHSSRSWSWSSPAS